MEILFNLIWLLIFFSWVWAREDVDNWKQEQESEREFKKILNN